MILRRDAICGGSVVSAQHANNTTKHWFHNAAAPNLVPVTLIILLESVLGQVRTLHKLLGVLHQHDTVHHAPNEGKP